MGIEFVDQSEAVRQQGRAAHASGTHFGEGTLLYGFRSEAFRHWCEGWLQADGALPCPNIRTSAGGTSHWCALGEQSRADAALREFLECEVMPRYVEMFEQTIGGESVIVEQAKALLSAPNTGPSPFAIAEAARAFVATVANVEATAEGKRLMEAVRGCESTTAS